MQTPAWSVETSSFDLETNNSNIDYQNPRGYFLFHRLLVKDFDIYMYKVKPPLLQSFALT